MKHKLIFALGLITIFGAFLTLSKRQSNSPRVLRASLMGIVSIEIKPENISTILLYHINHNIWDTLLTSDRSSAAARLVRVDPSQKIYSFAFDQNAKFSNGRAITAHDAVFSINRLLKLEESGHFNAKNLVDKAIAKNDLELEIHLIQPTPSFLFLLSTPEFGILPRESVDENTLAVKNAAVTSGAYSIGYISEKDQRIELKKNPFFTRHAANSPDIVDIQVHERSQSVPDLLRSGKAAFSEVSDSWADRVIEESKKIENITVKVTRPSVSTFLVANQKSISPNAARIFLATFDEALNFESPTERRSHQLLPEKTFGALSPSELSRPTPVPEKLPNPLIIRINTPDSPLAAATKAIGPQLGTEIKIVDRAFKGEVHFYAAAQGMNADYPEIELYLTILGPYAFVPASQDEKQLVEKAIHESDDTKRLDLIKRIGLSLLNNARIVPSTLRSYVHLSNSKIIDASEITNYDGDIPFYKIRMLE